MISIQKVKFYWNLNTENLKKKERKVIILGNKTFKDIHWIDCNSLSIFQDYE